MSDQERVSRRTILKGAAAVGAGLAMSGHLVKAEEAGAKGEGLSFRNEQFYGPDGKFNVEAGKDAIIKLMEYHKYPVFKDVRERLWVSDYGLGQFTKLGLAAWQFINDQEGNFMVMDLYLLPNQMLPEHCHLATAKCAAKMEGWVVRHGISYVYGEGEPTKDMKAVIPDFEKGNVTVYHETILLPGQSAKLNRKEARHWQFAGPEGAILTESATYHDNDGVRHTDPKIIFP
jgi:D-lyxose ketol-isomerase